MRLSRRIRIRIRLQRDSRGASLVEYALILALVVVVCVVSVTLFGGALNNSFSKDASSVAATP